VIAAQRDLYRAKAFVDFCVGTALATVAIAPDQPATQYVDVLGSVIVAAYLLLSGIRAAQTHLAQSKGLLRDLEKQP
jgi:predicted permease